MRLEGKVALITGGTSGIGQRTIERFTAEGANVTFTGRRAAKGNEVAGETGATFIEADAGQPEDAERAVKQTLDRNGRLDVLMNNAGAPATPGRIENLPLESFDEAIAVHVRGAL
ncbi:MAG: SDR family NAD(P)-dependent oxidoreductase, partial [Pseudomonadota bacterium]